MLNHMKKMLNISHKRNGKYNIEEMVLFSSPAFQKFKSLIIYGGIEGNKHLAHCGGMEMGTCLVGTPLPALGHVPAVLCTHGCK